MRMETAMTERNEERSKNTNGNAPSHQGGDSARKAQRWAGGNKAAKGPVAEDDKQNENSSAKS
jgi:hypothetical protein